MKIESTIITIALLGLAGCAQNQAPDVAGNIRNSLKQAGFNDVSVSQDRTKGVVTLGGSVLQDADKQRADQIAKSEAQGQVVADEIAVLSKNASSAAKTVDSDLDKGIENNLDAALLQNNIKGIRHSTKNGVVTLNGDLPTPQMRSDAERLAAAVPNVQQVVNKIDVKNQRATSSSADRSK